MIKPFHTFNLNHLPTVKNKYFTRNGFKNTNQNEETKMPTKIHICRCTSCNSTFTVSGFDDGIDEVKNNYCRLCGEDSKDKVTIQKTIPGTR